MIRHQTILTALIASCVATVASPAPALAEAPVEVLATYPAPTFLENLDVAPDGAIYVTNYTGRGIERLRPGQPADRFATLSHHPVSILAMKDGFLVAVHGTSFTQGPAFIGSGRLIRLGPTGAVVADTPVPDIGMLNGMVRIGEASALIADSVKGQILRYELTTGALTTWFADARLAPQTSPHFRPGANGLKVSGTSLLVTSSAQRKVYRVAIGAGGVAAGALEPLHDLPGADDFAVLPDGNLIMTTHGDKVLRIAANGMITTLTADPRVLGNTAVAITGTGAARRAIVLGTGGFSAGGTADAAVVAIPLPE